MKWPFSRNKNTSDQSVPPEVQDYYQAENRDRTGKAWILAALTLIVTVAAVLALFFGGRWLYRAITDRNGGESTSQTEDANQNESDSAPTGDDDGNGDTTADDGATDGSGDENGDTSQGDEEVDPNATPPSPDSDPTPDTPAQPSPSEVPSTGQGDTEVLPSTGGMDN